MKSTALVLGCELIPDGSDIGPQTVARLVRALKHHKATGEQLVVATSWSPRHPLQNITMATLMSQWLEKKGYCDALVLEAKRFNTRGELQAWFASDRVCSSIISDPLHLRRTKIIVRKMKGKDFADTMNYVPTEATAMTAKGQMLEPLKRAFLYLPFWAQDGVIYLLHNTPLRKINLSY